MSIEITVNIKAPEIAVAIARLALAIERSHGPQFHVEATQAEIKGGELEIPAGTDLTVKDVTPVSDLSVEPMKMPEPEKPKRSRKAKPEPAAEAPAESAQDAPREPEEPQAAVTPAEPEKPAESTVVAPVAPAPTIDQIAAAGAKLLDDDAAKMMPLLGLLQEFGVQAITQLKSDQLGAFADKLRGLGAEV